MVEDVAGQQHQICPHGLRGAQHDPDRVEQVGVLRFGVGDVEVQVRAVDDDDLVLRHTLITLIYQCACSRPVSPENAGRYPIACRPLAPAAIAPSVAAGKRALDDCLSKQ